MNGFGFTHSAFGRLVGVGIFFLVFAASIIAVQRNSTSTSSTNPKQTEEIQEHFQSALSLQLKSSTLVDDWQVLLNQSPLENIVTSETEFSGEFHKGFPADSELVIGVRPVELFSEAETALRLTLTLGDQQVERTIWGNGELSDAILLGEFFQEQ